MITLGELIILTFALGFAFGPVILSGLLPRALANKVQMVISVTNTGGAWNNANKFIESGVMIDDMGEVMKKEFRSTKQLLLKIQLEIL